MTSYENTQLVNSLDIRYVPSQITAMLISNPIEKVHASWHMACVGPHTRGMCFKIQKKPNSLILIDLVHKIQPNSPFAAFGWMVTFPICIKF